MPVAVDDRAVGLDLRGHHEDRPLGYDAAAQDDDEDEEVDDGLGDLDADLEAALIRHRARVGPGWRVPKHVPSFRFDHCSLAIWRLFISLVNSIFILLFLGWDCFEEEIIH